MEISCDVLRQEALLVTQLGFAVNNSTLINAAGKQMGELGLWHSDKARIQDVVELEQLPGMRRFLLQIDYEGMLWEVLIARCRCPFGPHIGRGEFTKAGFERWETMKHKRDLG